MEDSFTVLAIRRYRQRPISECYLSGARSPVVTRAEHRVLRDVFARTIDIHADAHGRVARLKEQLGMQ